jgi:hypothetical protein
MKPSTQLALDNAEEAVRTAQANRLTDVESAAQQMHLAQLAVWREQLEALEKRIEQQAAPQYVTFIPTHPSMAHPSMVAEGGSDDSIRRTLRREVEARYGKASPSIEAYPTHPKPR